MNFQSLRRGIVFLSLFAASLAVADSAERFGLHHFSLGQATVQSNDFNGLIVENLDPDDFSGTNGIATELGEADSGAFIFPDASGVSDGYFMTAHVYGSVGHVPNSPIGIVRGRRAEYATFYASADYSAIGATSVTFQVWSGNIMLARSEGIVDEVRMYAEYSQPPRVNPWWRQENGEYGASIEFGYPLPIVINPCGECDSGQSYFGNRIFIRPNGATNVVDYVSRTEVFGGGGLPDFQYQNVQLGMFARAHTALGPARLIATNGVLTIGDLPPLPDDGAGVLVDFQRAATAEVHLSPLDIAVPNTNQLQEFVSIGLVGTRSNYNQFIGAAGLASSNGVLHLLNLFDGASVAALIIYSNNIAVGTSSFPANVSATIGGTPRLVSVDANADTLTSAAGIAFRFDTAATFQVPGGDLFTGDRAVIGLPQRTGVADVMGLSIETHFVSDFTIVNESSTSSVPHLSVQRLGDFITLSWPDPAGAFVLQRKESVDASFSTLSYLPTYQNGIATITVPVMGDEVADIEFFQLARFAYPY